MKFTKIASVLLAVLLVATAGAAAMPGNAPDKAQAGQTDDTYENGSDAEEVANETAMENGSEMKPDHAGNGSETGAAAADDKRGPPTDMPEQVPDFVTEVHELINQKLNGTLEDLGQALSGVTPGEDAADEESTDADDAGADEQDDADEDDESEQSDADEDSDESDSEEDSEQDDAEEDSDSEQDDVETDDTDDSQADDDDSQA